MPTFHFNASLPLWCLPSSFMSTSLFDAYLPINHQICWFRSVSANVHWIIIGRRGLSDACGVEDRRFRTSSSVYGDDTECVVHPRAQCDIRGVVSFFGRMGLQLEFRGFSFYFDNWFFLSESLKFFIPTYNVFKITIFKVNPSLKHVNGLKIFNLTRGQKSPDQSDPVPK